MFKVLIVEDDTKIAEIIRENMGKWGMDALVASDFTNIIRHYSDYQPHLVLLDITLPSYDGYYWCQKLRQISQVPIVFLSSRSENMDMIMAMNMGADDFITKPFSLELLLAKVNAMLRRAYSYTDTKHELLEVAGAALDIADKTLHYQGAVLELTKNEFRILHLLMSRHGTIVDRDRIMRCLWEDESFVDDNTLTVNINRLRKKLADLGLADWIVTRKNQGYMIS